jgi:hypothetical protein
MQTSPRLIPPVRPLLAAAAIASLLLPLGLFGGCADEPVGHTKTTTKTTVDTPTEKTTTTETHEKDTRMSPP